MGLAPRGTGGNAGFRRGRVAVEYAQIKEAAAMAKRKYQTQKEAGIILAVCGVISGLLSTYVNLPDFALMEVPLLPAIFFGIVVALGIYSWEARHPAPIAIVFIGVIVAWWCAYWFAITFYDRNNDNALIWLGAASGAIGALITSIALWIASEDFRTIRNVAMTVVFGALAGTLLRLMTGFDTVMAPVHGLAPLFVIWQAGVAGLIGYALAFRPRPE
jgi:hypothetical protein